LRITRIVDAHHHFWDLGNYYPWLSDQQNPGMDIRPFARDFLADHYRDEAAPIDVVKSVHVQAGWNPQNPVGETEWLTRLAEETGFPHAIVAYADLAADDTPRMLVQHARSPLLRGIRMLLTWHPNPALRRASRPDYLTDRQWLRGLSAMAELGLSFDMQLFPAQMGDAAKVAECFTAMRFIIDHLGLPVDQSEDGKRAWEAGMRRLAASPNVAVKLSGFSHFLSAWSREAARPFVDFALSTFGPERCLFGSNYPVERPLAAFPTLVEDLAGIVAEHGADAVERVFATNAEEWYRLNA
jgi:predicted TIM-barrel fold metal-dependent hydrolase